MGMPGQSDVLRAEKGVSSGCQILLWQRHAGDQAVRVALDLHAGVFADGHPQ